jgi:hypothetical protein
MATYTDPEPASGAELMSVSQPLITGNFTYLKQSYGKDHNFTSTSNTSVSNADGHHTVVHQVTQVADPASIASVNQVYSKSYTPDTTGGAAATQLFSQSSNGSVFQLTGISGSTEGFAWTGGLLIQWGQVTFAAGNDHLTATVTFKDRAVGSIPFPTTCLGVIATLKNNDTAVTTASNTIAIRSYSATTFVWLYNSSSSIGSTNFPGFNWIAIGY